MYRVLLPKITGRPFPIQLRKSLPLWADRRSEVRRRFWRARRFNRLDPFFGNVNDPLSLHKYLYVHGDPVRHADPSGMLLSSLNVAMGIAARLIIGAATFAGIWVLAAPRIAMLGATANLRPLAESLSVKIKSRTEIKTERNKDKQYKWFAHGSVSALWQGATKIAFTGGKGPLGSDFGIGFYAYEASTEGMDQAFLRAQQMRRQNPRGQGFVLVFRILVDKFNAMSKLNLGTRFVPDVGYLAFVAANRASPAFHNVDYVYGATAKQDPPNSGVWVANATVPEQYKFEPSAEPSVERYAVVPVI